MFRFLQYVAYFIATFIFIARYSSGVWDLWPASQILGRFRSSTSTSTSTSFQLRGRSTHIERESPSELVLVAAVQYDFHCKSRTEQNEFGIDNIGQNKCAIHKQLPR